MLMAVRLEAISEELETDNDPENNCSPFARIPVKSSQNIMTKNITNNSTAFRDFITSAVNKPTLNSAEARREKPADQTGMGAVLSRNGPRVPMSIPDAHNQSIGRQALTLNGRPAQKPSDQTKSVLYSTIIPNLSVVRSKNRRPGHIVSTISTSFAHPIKLNHSPPANGSKPCHWCHDFTYGLLGLGQLQVKVKEKLDGSGYLELGDGHIARGKEPSRMCRSCRTERSRIVRCPSHIMQPIKELDERKFDFRRAFQTLFPDSREGRCIKRNLWCALCISPAFYRCTRGHAEKEGGGSKLDCGLSLCGTCARIIGTHGGSIYQLIETRKKTKANLRADVEFFAREGELYWRYNA